MKWGMAMLSPYLHPIKLKRMNKKEIKNAINKAAYKYAESLGYQVVDDGDGSCVTFWKPDADADDSIDWDRSSHYTCTLNWASDDTKFDEVLIEKYMKPIIEHFKAQYVDKRVKQR